MNSLHTKDKNHQSSDVKNTLKENGARDKKENALSTEKQDVPFPLPLPLSSTSIIKKDNPHHTTDAYNIISEERLLSFMKPALKGKTHLVSIGSGTGHHETVIMKAFKLSKDSVICVDKKSTAEYSSEIPLPPHASSVDELLRLRPTTGFSNACVLIHWPNPAASNDHYDIEAICKLLPASIVIVYGKDGVSGSDGLVEWVQNMESKSDVYDDTKPYSPKHIYRVLAKYEENQKIRTNQERLFKQFPTWFTDEAFKESLREMEVKRFRAVDVVLLARKGSMMDMRGVHALVSSLKK
jgi:hypothetical protein